MSQVSTEMEQGSLRGSRWCRASAYVVRNDSISVAPRATLEEYDLWVESGAWVRPSNLQPPYAELFDVLRRYDLLSTYPLFHGYIPPPDLCADIQQWCTAYGLLGILPHTEERIEVPPIWAEIPTSVKGSSFAVPTAVMKAAEYIRRNGAWDTRLREYLVASEFAVDGVEDSPVASEAYPEGNPWQEAARVANIYFKRDRYRGHGFWPPRPLSQEFWRSYQEPVKSFIEWARLLFVAVEALSRPISVESAPRLDALNKCVEVVGRKVRFIDGKMREEAVYPSLLSFYARMALEESQHGMNLRWCESCGRAFFTDAYQKRHCTQTCAWRRRKRLQRLDYKERLERAKDPRER